MRRWLLAALIALVFSASVVALPAHTTSHGEVRAHQACAEPTCDPGPADLARAGVVAVEPSRFAAVGGAGPDGAAALPDSLARPASRAELQVWRT